MRDWFFNSPLTVGQFWAPKGGPGAKSSRSKNTDLRARGIRRVLRHFATTRTSGFTLPSRAHLQDDARSKQLPQTIPDDAGRFSCEPLRCPFASWKTDLYPVFSLDSLICTLVLQFVLYPVFSEGGWDQISMKHAKSRYRSNCKTKVQIKEIKENQGYRSDPQDHKPKVQITTSLLICTLGFP